MRFDRRNYSDQHRQPVKQDGPQTSSLGRKVKRMFFLFILIFLVLGAGITALWWSIPPRWLPIYDKNIILTTDNLDVQSNLIFILYYRQKTQEIQLQVISAEGEVSVPGGYGKYPLRSVLPLTRLEKKTDAEIQALYSYIFDTPIDHVWSTVDAEVFHLKDQRDLGNFFFLKQIKGQFTWKERLAWVWLFRHQPQQIPDSISLQAWQEKANTQKDKAAYRDCRVSIVNTTKTPGLAGRAERVLTQAGATVLRVTDQETSTSSSKIFYQPENKACETLLRYLPSIFPQVIPITADKDVFQRGRSELEIILGEDLARFLAN